MAGLLNDGHESPVFLVREVIELNFVLKISRRKVNVKTLQPLELPGCLEPKSLGLSDRAQEDSVTIQTLLTVAEVANLLKVSEDWVRSHATRSNPRLPSVKIGGSKGAPLRFKPSDIQEFIEKWTKSK